MLSRIVIQFKQRLDTVFHAFPTFAFSSFLFFFLFGKSAFQHFQWVPCTVYGTHKSLFSHKLSLKMGLMILFTHLKIILLQCFQFSVK